MQAWIEYIRSNNPGLLWRNSRNSDYGDWLTTDATDKVLVATAHFARAVQVAHLTAEVLELDDEALRYGRLHAEIASAYRDAFIGGEGAGLDTQAAAVFALAFDLALPDQRAEIAARLIRDVERRGHLTVGFMAVRFTLPLLCEFGRADLAAAMLFREETPSWGYQIKRGLTTIGEHWDAWDEHGVLLDSWMNSFNHVVLGAVGEWMYREIGGIAPAEPGYRSLRVAPRIDLGISAAECFHVSPYGRIHTRWSVEGSEFHLELTVPANTTATVMLPGAQNVDVGSGTHTFLTTLPVSPSQGVVP
jgi:alpha-L-rhamnosidase